MIKRQFNRMLSRGKQFLHHLFVEKAKDGQNTDFDKESDFQLTITSLLRKIDPKNTQWLEKVDQILIHQITTPNFDVEVLAAGMKITRQYLNTRIKLLTGQTAVQYVQMARLKRARELLNTQAVSSVQEAAETVGFRDVKYFSQLYKKNFGVLPSSHF